MRTRKAAATSSARFSPNILSRPHSRPLYFDAPAAVADGHARHAGIASTFGLMSIAMRARATPPWVRARGLLFDDENGLSVYELQCRAQLMITKQSRLLAADRLISPREASIFNAGQEPPRGQHLSAMRAMP